MKRLLSRMFRASGSARRTRSELKARRRRTLRFEPLEKREVLSTNPILMASGADLSSPEFAGPAPDPAHLWMYSSVGVIGKDAYGNKIDFNRDGYGDTLQTGRVDEILDYGSNSSNSNLVACSRGDFLLANLGGPSGALIPLRNGTGQACGGFVHSGTMVEATAIDLNQDGYEDLLGLGGNFGAKGTRVEAAYWDPLNKSFSGPVVINTIQAWGAKFASWQFGDVNGDGILDMVTPNFDATAVNTTNAYIGFDVFLGVPNGTGHFSGTFQAAPWATVAARTSVLEWGVLGNGGLSLANPSITPVLADLNGDGKLDLAIPEIDGMTVFTNPGNGQFVSGSGVFTAAPTGSHGGPQLKAGDFDKDGDLDLVDSPNLNRQDMLKPVSSSLNSWEPAPGPITVFRNNSPTGGTPSFTGQSIVAFEPGGGYNGQIEIADFNNDGKMDLAVASCDQTSLLYGILPGNGDGTFGNLQVHAGYADTDGLSQFERGVKGIAAVDTNNDGQIDIATVALNNGTTMESSPKNHPAVSILGVSLNKTYQMPTVTGTTPPAATQGKPYSYQLVSTGGNPNEPFTFTLDQNSVPLPAGLTLSPSGLISGKPTQSGPFNVLVDIVQPSGIHGSSIVPLVVKPGLTSTPILVVAPEAGGQPVRVLNPDGSLVATIDAFFGYKGAVRVATGDVTGDGYNDIVAICGLGITTEVRVFDGVTRARVLKFAPYGKYFMTGGYVAVGDVLPDHPGNEIIVSPQLGLEKVRVFDGVGRELTSFTPYSKYYSGAVPIAVGNIDGIDGDEIAVAIGAGCSEVRWFDGYGNLEGKFKGYGNQIAVGDVDGDGKAEVVLTAGVGFQPIIRIYDPKFGVLDAQFYGYDPKYYGGLRVTLLRRADGSRYDIVTALEAKKPTTVSIYDGKTGAKLTSYLAYPSVFAFGLNIAGG